MGSLSKEEVMRLINERRSVGDRTAEEGGSLARSILEKVGGMMTPRTKRGGKATRAEYLRYVEEEQAAGRQAKTFAEWAKAVD